MDFLEKYHTQYYIASPDFNIMKFFSTLKSVKKLFSVNLDPHLLRGCLPHYLDMCFFFSFHFRKFSKWKYRLRYLPGIILGS